MARTYEFPQFFLEKNTYSNGLSRSKEFQLPFKFIYSFTHFASQDPVKNTIIYSF